MPDELREGGPRRVRRARTTHPRVIWVDRLATTTITIGGTAVIAAVLGILVYLVAVVWPLFSGAELARGPSFPVVEPAEASNVLIAEVDEYRSLGLVILAGGEAVSFDARDGRTSRTRILPEVAPIAAVSRVPDGRAAIALADGTIRLATLGFRTTYFQKQAAAGNDFPGLTAVEELPTGGMRRVEMIAAIDPPLDLGEGAPPVRLIDYRPSDSGGRLALHRVDGSLELVEISSRKNLLTGAILSEASTVRIPVPTDRPDGDPAFLLVTTAGDQLYLAWADGRVLRWDLRDPSDPLLAETTSLLGRSDTRLTALRLMPGEQSLLAGDSAGGVSFWFRVSHPDAGPDGFSLVAAHRFPPEDAPIAAVATSRRDKSFLSVTTAGVVNLRHMTSERGLAATVLSPPAAPVAAQIAPKNDGLFVLGADGRASLFSLASPHPETSLTSLFGAVWYEGYPARGFTWQSTGGTDDFEPKLSLVPLLFGTVKATLYSMLFAVPIALCAAIYTSEFLDRRLRSPIKSVVEVMAALPSVVLGFLAALVLAPLVESWVLAVLTAFAVIPLSVLLAGYLWQALPPHVTLRFSGSTQFALLVGVVVGACALAPRLAAFLETVLFAGDFKGWLDHRAGGPAAGIGLAAWPLLLAGLLAADRLGWFGGRLRGPGPIPGAAGGGWGELGRFVLLLALSLSLAWVTAMAGSALGLDVRDLILGTYVQRNALVVGFVMGFAVIPIIYTIAEDALSTVPQSLRSASLGCGATRWQTATRVILPVAASGIFSALMVGLGRAVGETMIVLMAAGNTPIIDLNLFNGLRTLSANIAVELPEAARNGTLFRVLFLAALLLFCLTFVVNTLAELVRQRFRRRAFQL